MTMIACEKCGKILPVDLNGVVRCGCGHIFHRLVGLAPTESPFRPKTKSNCTHRGNLIGTADCGCAGNLKVHQCGIHGFAMDRKLKPGKVLVAMEHGKHRVDVRYCNACDDFTTDY
jgi:hypothetical protein